MVANIAKTCNDTMNKITFTFSLVTHRMHSTIIKLPKYSIEYGRLHYSTHKVVAVIIVFLIYNPHIASFHLLVNFFLHIIHLVLSCLINSEGQECLFVNTMYLKVRYI